MNHTLLSIAAACLTMATAGTTQPAQRIVSLVPALTEMVFAIGAGDRVIAVSSFDEDPPAVKNLPRVGALLDPDVERIIAMRADLVLLYGSQTDLMTQLQRAAIPYYEYRHAGLAGVTGTIRALGQRVGHEKQAEALAAGIDRRFAALRQRTASLQKPRTLLVFSRERGALRNIYASGGRGFLHDMLEAAGGVNIFADIQMESVQASSELILARAPEVILELRSTDIPPEAERIAEMGAWKVLASVPAVRNDRLYFLPGRALVVPGPNVGEGAEAMRRVLHPRQ
ncbi:MAG: ABC transporter substrate-binding protein [Acidobacteria bacterium]|nr:ABC transporter substrate-binding protein [Acidobacteriota bacterium]